MEKVEVEVDLTRDELLALGDQAGRLDEEISGIEERAKSAAAEYKATLQAKEAEAGVVASKLRRKREMRSMECRVVFHAGIGKKALRRMDTGDLVATREMLESDYQRVLPMGDRALDECTPLPVEGALGVDLASSETTRCWVAEGESVKLALWMAERNRRYYAAWVLRNGKAGLREALDMRSGGEVSVEICLRWAKKRLGEFLKADGQPKGASAAVMGMADGLCARARVNVSEEK